MFAYFLGLDDNIDAMDRTKIGLINEENINNWLQPNLRKKDGKLKKACSLDNIRSSTVYPHNYHRVEIPEKI